MSRFEGKLTGAEVPLDPQLLARWRQDRNGERHEAIARYLSHGDGWDQATKKLDGAFAGGQTQSGTTR